MKLKEKIKDKLVHYVKTHDENTAAKVVSWILIGAMTIAFCSILSCSIISSKADDNETYDSTTTLIDENGKAYIWIGEDTYARPDTYEENIHSVEWRKHIREDHPLGYRTIFKWDCPTCLTNLVSEQNIISNTETELTYKGVNMATKQLYAITTYGYGNTITDPPQVNALLSYLSDTVYNGNADNAGFLAGTTQENAVVTMCLNFSKVTGMKFVFIAAVPTNSSNTSFRVIACYKNASDTHTITCTTENGKQYIESSGTAATLYAFGVGNNMLSIRSTVSVSTTKTEFATTTSNAMTVNNMRLLYFNPNQEDTVRWYEGSTLPNTPSVQTPYDPLREAQLAGQKYEKIVTTNILTNLYEGSNQVLLYKWAAIRMVNNYAVIASGGNVTEEDIEGWQEEGRQQVINNPNNYNLYTATQYNAMRTTGRNDVINNPHTYNLYTDAEYTAYGQAEYQRGYMNASGTPSTQDWKISSVVKAVPEGMYTFYQNIVEPIQDPTEELLGVNVGALVAVVAVIGLVVIGIAIVKKVF